MCYFPDLVSAFIYIVGLVGFLMLAMLAVGLVAGVQIERRNSASLRDELERERMVDNTMMTGPHPD